MLFSKQTTKHDEIYLKENWMNDDAQQLKKKDVWDDVLIFNKEDKICLLIDLIDSLANNERFFIVESINWFDSWAIHEDSLLWF